MIRVMVVVAAALLLSAATATVTRAQEGVIVGIDADITGSDATTIGQIDGCISAEAGETFQINVFIQNIPPVAGNTGGLSGFVYSILFDPAVIEVTGVDNELLVTSQGEPAPITFIDADGFGGGGLDPLPATTGNLQVNGGDLSENYEAGNGVLSRLDLVAKAPGTTTLRLLDVIHRKAAPTIYAASPPTPYPVGSVYNASVVVGSECGAETPTPYVPPDGGAPGSIEDLEDEIDLPTPTATGGSSSAEPPATNADGSTTAGTEELPSLAVDILPAGNDATSIGEIDDCAAADVGDVFQVDVVIQDVQDLLAWEIALSYDLNVLEVEDRDVKLFQAATDGSSVIDSSASTPENTGRYVLGAVDSADPLNPESGDGVLARVTLKAIGEGTSPVETRQLDLDGNGTMDQGVFLRNADGSVIGDVEGEDTFFDGATEAGEIRVGEDCPDSDARVQLVSGDGVDGAEPDEDDGDDGLPLIPIIVVAVLAVAALGAGAAYYLRRRAAQREGL